MEAYLGAFSSADAAQSKKSVAEILCLLGRAQRRTGHFAAAEQSLNRSIKSFEEAGYGDSPEVCQALNECAFLFCLLAQYGASEALLARALAIQESHLPPEHLDIATTLLHQSEVMFLTGDAPGALAVCQKALALRRKELGVGHPEMAEALELYGFYLKNIGRLEEAEAALVESVSIIEASLGAEHAAVANCLVGLAEVLMTREKYGMVESLLRRAEVICENRIGESSQPSMMVLNTLAVYYATQGRLNQALPLLEEALAIGEQLFGPEHSSLANIVNNLAVFYKFLGREKDFQVANERAKALLRLSLVKTEGTNTQALISLADKLCLNEQYIEAAEMLERALDLAVRQYGEKSLKAAEVLHAMAASMIAQKKWAEAEDFCTRVIEIFETELGTDGQQLASPLRLLAACRLQLGDRVSCEELFERAQSIEQKHDMPDAGLAAVKMDLEARKSRLGEDHPSVTEAMRVYGLALQHVGDDESAFQYLSDYVLRRSRECAPHASSFLQDIITNIILIQVGKNKKAQAFQLLDLSRMQISVHEMKTNLLSTFLLFEAEFLTEDLSSALSTARSLALMCKPPEKVEVIVLARQTLVNNAETLKKQGRQKVSEELLAIANSISLN